MSNDFDTERELALADVLNVKMTVRNKLSKEKRDISVYHQSNRSSHIISYNSSLTQPLNIVDHHDYIHVSAISGPGHFKHPCVMNIPAWMDFEYTSAGDLFVSHSGNRTFIKIPPGFPRWELKVRIPRKPLHNGITGKDFIKITDSEEEINYQ